MADNHAKARAQLLRTIVAETRQTAHLTGREQLQPRVLDALAETPRHIFVPAERQALAYNNMPLPIGQGQTISQPFIVALMSDLLAVQPEHTVLEIGTGSGYQTAVLARLARFVYSVERLPVLAEQAECRIRELKLDNVAIQVADGHEGWPEQAPYDGIIVTAAAAQTPVALLAQLKPGGRLVIPVGLPHRTQNLQLICKDDAGQIHVHSILAVAFVPLIGESQPN